MLIPDDDPSATLAGPLAFLAIGLVVLQVVLFIGGLISVIASPRYTGGGKFLWVVVIFFAPFLGPLGWFIAGRHAQIRTNVP